ncbi:hypothetical protein O181_001185 [Austropuccinia psidii MF-1]|uniref:Uncharacterized protein n=1 Tax=Austropuccinia psidii MF-1 TaxID=1389203 RepID=A0A9Q3GBK4_9BASI|nr:hypothetical protein [Austropuccinia psidii MF-1]
MKRNYSINFPTFIFLLTLPLSFCIPSPLFPAANSALTAEKVLSSGADLAKVGGTLDAGQALSQAKKMDTAEALTKGASLNQLHNIPELDSTHRLKDLKTVETPEKVKAGASLNQLHNIPELDSTHRLKDLKTVETPEKVKAGASLNQLHNIPEVDSTHRLKDAKTVETPEKVKAGAEQLHTTSNPAKVAFAPDNKVFLYSPESTTDGVILKSSAPDEYVRNAKAWNLIDSQTKLSKTVETVQLAVEKKIKLGPIELERMKAFLDQAKAKQTVFNIPHEKATIAGTYKELEKLIRIDDAARAAKAGGFWNKAINVAKLPFKPISWTKNFLLKIVERIALRALYATRPSKLAPATRAKIAADKEKITKMGQFARKLRMNPQAWTPSLQNNKPFWADFGNSPLGKLWTTLAARRQTPTTPK